MSIATDIAQIRKEYAGQQKLKILTMDIETSPNMAYVWSLWKENIPLERFLESGKVIAIGAKWYDKPDVIFLSDFHTGHDEMIYQTWDLFDEADIVVEYNGDGFDIPHTNTEFAKLGLNPPSPYKTIDLLKVVRKNFKLPSNKLAYVAPYFGVGDKIKHSGFDLWTRCMAGDSGAWEEMRVYCEGDVIVEENLYTYLRPWIRNHPNAAPVEDGDQDVCVRCGSSNLSKTSKEDRTLTMKYGAVICLECGGWMRDKTSERISNLRSI